MNLGKKETENVKVSMEKDGIDNIKSVLIIDLLGPVIDIGKIPDFRRIPNGRYCRKDEIVAILERGGEQDWDVGRVTKLIRKFLNPAFHVSIIDMNVLKLLVEAKKYAEINIISGIENDELLNEAIDAVIKCSNELCGHLKRKRKEKDTKNASEVSTRKAGERDFDELENFEALRESDFVRISGKEIQGVRSVDSMKNLINKSQGLEIYTIIFSEEDDPLNSNEDGNNNTDMVREWISGVSDKQCMEKFKEKIEKMKQIKRANYDLKKLLPNEREKEIKIDEVYTIDQKFRFNVFEDQAINVLRKRIKDIRDILSAERKAGDGKKPICIFLAGAPGAGKSYFVKEMAKWVRDDGKYRVTSLSGVPKKDFADAVVNHIKAVYDTCDNASGNIVAFLDEVDTKGEVDEYAFRLLMDAMTGNKPDGKGGIEKTEVAKNLVWLFAGSAKNTREEFVDEFKGSERKVGDFFDRIHFFIQLPGVQSSGQAILTFLSTLGQPSSVSEITVEKSVLYLFGRTVWKSARQIKTVNRIATAKLGFEWWKKTINLDCFGGIDVLTEFITTHKVIKEWEEKKMLKRLGLDGEIIIKFKNKSGKES